MNTKEAGKAWNVSKKEALLFCDEGMIPTATKTTKKDYEIPHGTPKPLCHRATAIVMMENILSIKQENGNPYLRGYSYDKIIEMYEFLMDCGFISGFEIPTATGRSVSEKRDQLRKALKKCKVLKRGKNLIEAGKMPIEEDKLRVEEVDLGGSANVGPAELHGDVKMRRRKGK